MIQASYAIVPDFFNGLLDITLEEEREMAQVRLAELQQGKVDHYVIVKQYRRKDGTVMWGIVPWRGRLGPDWKCLSERRSILPRANVRRTNCERCKPSLRGLPV